MTTPCTASKSFCARRILGLRCNARLTASASDSGWGMKLLVADEEADAGSGRTETNRQARARHSGARGNRLAGETRRPKPEDRKKAEGRGPKRPRSIAGKPGFRDLRLAGGRIPAESIPVAGRRLGPAAVGFARLTPTQASGELLTTRCAFTSLVFMFALIGIAGDGLAFYGLAAYTKVSTWSDGSKDLNGGRNAS